MTELKGICLNCNNNSTSLKLQKINSIHINCNCGFNQEVSLKEYISIFHNNRDNSNQFWKITNEINTGYEHLITYFKSLKQIHINTIFSKINELESSYEQSYEQCRNVLKLLQAIINNYDGSSTKKDNINEISININKCEDKSVDEVIQFFNEYNIIKNKHDNYSKGIKEKLIEDNQSLIVFKEKKFLLEGL